jgi:guanylate kinase
VVFDVDVVGGVNIKKEFGARALSIFIQPPGIDALKNRLIGRGTDSADEIEKRLAKAEYELTYAPMFDVVIVNDILDKALEQTSQHVTDFLNK